MNENENPEKLLKIIEKNQEFENFIKKAYQEILKYANIEKIEWLT
jgi:3-methyladenine DNA glycosylase AlkD